MGPRRATPPDLGVVVVSYNTRDLLDACLRCLQAELASAGWTTAHAAPADALRAIVWVVDNGSSDDSAAMVRANHPWVRLFDAERNLGFTAANNVVLRPWSQGEGCPKRILLLNPDAEIQPAALSTLVEALDARPAAAVVGPALHYADGRFQHAAFREPGLVQAALDLWPIPRLNDHPINGRYPRRLYATGEPFVVDFVLGACMLLRGEALVALGPLDEGFFMYCEEVDWCHRARRRDWSVWCVPRAEVLHHAGASSTQFRATSFTELWRSRLRYARRHMGPIRRAAYRGLVRLGLRRLARRDRLAREAGRIDSSEAWSRMAAYQAVWSPRSEGHASAARAEAGQAR